MTDDVLSNRRMLKACHEGDPNADHEFRVLYYNLIFATIREVMARANLTTDQIHDLADDCIGIIYEDWYRLSRHRRLYEALAGVALGYGERARRKLIPEKQWWQFWR